MEAAEGVNEFVTFLSFPLFERCICKQEVAHYEILKNNREVSSIISFQFLQYILARKSDMCFAHQTDYFHVFFRIIKERAKETFKLLF